MNVGEWIFKRAAVHPEGPFLKEEEVRAFTNREFNERVNRMAHALTAWGAGRGERVAVLMTNSTEFLEIFFACAKTGAELTEEALLAAIRDLIAHFKLPKKIVFVEEFPRNSVGKILKMELKELLQ